MENDVYTVEQVAELLNLHPKTVRRFIQDGKLKARKIGKQWRISGAELRDLTGNQGADFQETSNSKVTDSFTTPGDGKVQSKVQVSAVVDVLVADTAEAIRITNTLFAAMNCKDPSYGSSRCDHIFYKDEMKARFILWGTSRFIRDKLDCISTIVENKT